jgi:hypothetical protein
MNETFRFEKLAATSHRTQNFNAGNHDKMNLKLRTFNYNSRNLHIKFPNLSYSKTSAFSKFIIFFYYLPAIGAGREEWPNTISY